MELKSNDHFDAVIIGCGMSGLAAAIRLAMFGRKVIILEKHNAPGGLNSFYSFDGRKFDVGLHAVTNFVRPGVKGKPLTKLFRQLRIDRDEFALCEQKCSKVAFPDVELNFSNDFELLVSEIEKAFPNQIDNFQKLVKAIHDFNEFDLEDKDRSAKKIISQYITDPLLVDMLLLPLMYYGSAKENDMEFGQFVIMFKSIYQEGFARPFEGVRTIIKTLIDKYRDLGGMRKMKCAVKKIITQNNNITALELENGDTITADHVISSIGLVETLQLCNDQKTKAEQSNIGKLSFVETITILDKQPKELGWNDTIIFFNDWQNFEYQKPKELVDPRSGVICMPNNYQYENNNELDEGVLRVTAMANYDQWTSLDEDHYAKQKKIWYDTLALKAMSFLKPINNDSTNDKDKLDNLKKQTVYVDMFTPRTITKFTSHLDGAIYGAPNKVKNGKTHLDNLYICGTDQGFLGIIGAMLSGISMANYHILQKN